MSSSLKELMYDHNFLDELDSANTEEEVLNIFQAHGVQMDSKKLRILIDEAQKAMATTGELTDEQLKKVTGGIKHNDFKNFGWGKLFTPGVLNTMSF